MSIRIRIIDGLAVALCAVESDAAPGDIYLDDSIHYALAAKLAMDWQGRTINWQYPEEWAAMDSQKVRDAREIYERYAQEWASVPLAGQSHVSRTKQEQQDTASQSSTAQGAPTQGARPDEAAEASRAAASGGSSMEGEVSQNVAEATGCGCHLAEAVA